uniref:Uncharacterized protein n=1 Tax=Anopheles funestus TaxID=62324 RepID=A0A182S119_ANOFN
MKWNFAVNYIELTKNGITNRTL